MPAFPQSRTLIVLASIAGLSLGWSTIAQGPREGTPPRPATPPATTPPTSPLPTTPPIRTPPPDKTPPAEKPRAKAAGSVRIATYNILNLFDDRDDPSLDGRFDDMHDSSTGDRAKPAIQQVAAADAIRAINADIIALQEVESFDALIGFREDYLAEAGYDHIVSIDVGQERGIEQAVMSRYPITEARVWPHMALGGVHPENYGDEPNWNAGEPLECRRSPLVVTIEVPAKGEHTRPYQLTLFIVHHKSGGPAAYWREAESAKFTQLIAGLERETPGRNIAVLGDFNAQADEKSVRMYLDAGFRSIFPLAGSPAEGQSTHESGRSIDFILVNPSLEPELIRGSAFIHETPMRPRGSDYRTTPAPEGFASDHKPVVVDITPKDN